MAPAPTSPSDPSERESAIFRLDLDSFALTLAKGLDALLLEQPHQRAIAPLDTLDLDGEPAANGRVNLVMGDLNVDPIRLAGSDPSAARFTDFVGEGRPFHFISDAGRRATPTYASIVNIDHVASDTLDGSCWAAGITEGHPPVTDAVYFDHRPIVCSVYGALP